MLKAVYDRASRSVDDVNGWVRLSESIIRRIDADDYEYFRDLAQDFIADYATAAHSPKAEGRVLRFDDAPGDLPQAYYWMLEFAIEKNGRAPDRGIRYKTPYALATWIEGDVLEMLAISHWREEAAIPIRLLYPSDLGPQPEGNECTIRVSLPMEQADEVVQALIAACNGLR
jgi:hypothetical protein